MYTLEKIKTNIAKEINTALGKKFVQASDLIFPPNPEFGDLSLPCFDLFKKLKEAKLSAKDLILFNTPVELASRLVGRVETNKIFSSVKAIGPYLNFILNKNYLAESVIKEISRAKEKYGENAGGKKKKVIIEYSSANTHKEYHVGHLRNICYGDAVNRILKANGYKSIPVSYINDFGIHVAKTLWYYMNYYLSGDKPVENLLKEQEAKSKGFLLGVCYVNAVKELEKNEVARGLVALLMKKIESRKGVEYKLWQQTRKWSIEQFGKIYKELGIKFDHIFYESEVIDRGLTILARLYKKEVLKKSEGAVIADLEKYSLGVLVFLRSDGTALYPVGDLSLVEEKVKKYKPNESIYVVDVRQGQYFKQLFKILEITGYKQKMVHLGHEFVKLPSGMMSSRTGNVITYEDLREQALEKAVKETKKRHEDWSEKKIKDTAEKIIIGAIKFEMIKVSREQIITFDIDTALRFDGFTAAYLQYVYARIQSINKKALKQKNKKTKVDFNNLMDKKEQELIMKLAKYPEVVERAGNNYDPSEIAKYLFELARDYNDYYHSIKVLQAKEGVRDARLALISAVAQAIKNGLGILGIEVLDQM